MEAKKFFRALIAVLVLIYFLDFGIGSGLKWLYEHQKSGYLYRSNYCIDSTHSSFLVIGSSRANHHYDSKIFESQLNDSFYNCGRDGQNIIYSCAMASAIVHRYKPKLIIIDIRPNEFTIKDEDELTSLLPYHQNPVIRSYLPYYSRFENIKLLSRIYPYNSLLTSLVVGITEKNKKRTEDYRGFIRLDGVMQDKKFLEFREQGRLDSMKIIAFKNLLDQLDKKQIPAMIVISPLYEKYENTTTAKICSNICSQYHAVNFLNFADSAVSKEASFFRDRTHLNESGAQIFSREIVKCIRSFNSEDLMAKRRQENSLSRE